LGGQGKKILGMEKRFKKSPMNSKRKLSQRSRLKWDLKNGVKTPLKGLLMGRNGIIRVGCRLMGKRGISQPRNFQFGGGMRKTIEEASSALLRVKKKRFRGQRDVGSEGNNKKSRGVKKKDSG